MRRVGRKDAEIFPQRLEGVPRRRAGLFRERLVVAALDRREFEEHSRFRFDAARRRQRVRIGQVSQLRPRIDPAKFAHDTVFQDQRLVRVGKLADKVNRLDVPQINGHHIARSV